MDANTLLFLVFLALIAACLWMAKMFTDHERYVRKLRWFHENQPHVLRDFLLGRIDELPEPIIED